MSEVRDPRASLAGWWIAAIVAVCALIGLIAIFTAENPTRVAVRKGQILQLTVRGAEVDSVMVLDEIEPIEEDSPALFEILADEPGEYPIELVDAERQIGTLVVR